MKPTCIRRPLVVAAALFPAAISAGPQGGEVVAGAAQIGTPSAGHTVINQSSNSAIIHWQQFSSGVGEFVQFVQPSSSSVVLNRVVGGMPSELLGNLSANGRVFLVNPHGIVFGQGARVDVGGLFATTADIRNDDFLAGRYLFTDATSAAVHNAGVIRADDGGFVVLAAAASDNSGLIQANLGTVALASGSAFALSLDPTGAVSFAVDAAAIGSRAGVNNAGSIVAAGGRVLLTAQTAGDLLAQAVNHSGYIASQSAVERNGAVELVANNGLIDISGDIDVSGNSDLAGGQVSAVSAGDLSLRDGANILAGGRDGGSVRLVAGGLLSTAFGSDIQARATDSTGRGGFAELSGRGGLLARGAVGLGQGGHLLLDPDSIIIANGSGNSSSSGGVDTIFETTIENQLRDGVNVSLVADSAITIQNLSDGALDGRAQGNGGALTIATGTVDANGVITASANGSVTVANLGNSILSDGSVNVVSGAQTGAMRLGNVSSGMGVVSLRGVDIQAGTVQAQQDIYAGGDFRQEGFDDFGNGIFTALGAPAVVSLGNLTSTSGGVRVGQFVDNVGGASSFTTRLATTGAVTAGRDIRLRALESLTTGALSSASGILLRGAGSITVNGDVTADQQAGAGGVRGLSVGPQFDTSFDANGNPVQVVGNPLEQIQINGSISARHVQIGGLDAFATHFARDLQVTGAINAFENGGFGNEIAAENSVTLRGAFTSPDGLEVASNGSVDLSAVTAARFTATALGQITAGNIATSATNTNGDANARISISGGGVEVGNLSTEAIASAQDARPSALADVVISSGGSLSTGNVQTNAEATGVLGSSASARVQLSTSICLNCSSTASNGGAIASGNITTAAVGSIGQDGSVSIDATGGGVSTGLVNAQNDLSIISQINALGQGGDIRTGVVTANGNVSLRALAGNTNIGGITGSINALNLAAAQGLTVQGPLMAETVQVLGGDGLTNLGDIAASAGSVVVNCQGNTTLGNLSAAAGRVQVSVDAGSLTVGAVSARHEVSTGDANASISLFGRDQLTVGNLASTARSDDSGSFVPAVNANIDLASGGALQAGSISSRARNGESTARVTLNTQRRCLAGCSELTAGGAISAGGIATDADGGRSIHEVGASAIGGGITLSAVTGEGLTAVATGALNLGALSLGATGLSASSTAGIEISSLTQSGDLVLEVQSGNLSLGSVTAPNVRLATANGALTLRNARTQNLELSATNIGTSSSGGVIQADALSARASGSINFSDAELIIGEGVASFGSDAALLSLIASRAPNLRPSANGPNAAFAGASVMLGDLDIEGGYLFVDSPRLGFVDTPLVQPAQLRPQVVSSGSPLFLHLANSSNVAPFELPTAVATVVYGSSTATNDIQIGSGTAFINLGPSSPNFVFATQGTTRFPDTLRGGGTVVVLGSSQPANIGEPPPPPRPPRPEQDSRGEPLPVLVQDYFPDTASVVAPDEDAQQGLEDPNVVTPQNRGRVDRVTSGSTLSCGA